MARVLLVDDEKVARAVYGDYLADAGHEVHAVSGVTEARAALALHPFDIVVTDLILPQGDGMEVLRHTKERYPDVEVVLITALDKVGPAVRAIKSGAAEYLVKPVRPEALRHAVSRALTTRHLLQENAALRRHVALVEAGQRLLTVLDRGRLGSAAAGAFVQLCQVSAALVWTRGPNGELRHEAADGVPGQFLAPLQAACETHLRAHPSRAFELTALPHFAQGVAVPALDPSAGLRGWAVLLLEGAEPAGMRDTASYLAQHLALALHHADRIEQAEDLVYLDDLTRLYNARYLDEALEREFAGADGHQPFSILFLDLDYFKTVNDTHGHLVGSKLLIEAARVVKSCTRDQDVVARWGGDEYVILLRETDSGGALKVAERIRRAVESHHFLAREGYGLSLTTCVGVASYPEHATDKRTLVDQADRAMYRGKKSSRNVVYLASPNHTAVPAARSGAA
ncbi:MAG: diguanylate cyclase [Myxococcaceae bacterium]